MNEKHLKWANCCSKDISCSACDSNATCSDWAIYLDGHRRAKGYCHFDLRTSLADSATRRKVLNPEWVSHHGFFPLIRYEQKRDKFGVSGGIAQVKHKEPRVIRYCSHLDRCVFQRYAFLFDEAYEAYIKPLRVGESVIAYRRGEGKSNIDHAKRAFDFIQKTSRCIVIATDFKSFFETIDHAELKSSLCKVLGVDLLPDDYYAVFKNTTRYSSWDWDSLVRLSGLEGCRSARKEMNAKERLLNTEEFKKNVKSNIELNTSGKGVPQGSPVSAVYSNIYLLDFDLAIKDIVDSAGGMYLRYCDDVFIAIPIKKDFHAALQVVENALKCVEQKRGLCIQEEKTKRLLFWKDGGVGRFVPMDAEGNAEVGAKGELVYLGLVFDGESYRLAPRTISRYHYRMRRKAKTVAKQGKGRKNLYGAYSGRSKDISGHGSFVDYAKRASHKMPLNDPEATAIIDHNMEKIAKAINEKREGFS